MVRFVRALCLGAALALASSLAHAAGILPMSGTQQFDKDSSPPAFLVGGKIFVYLPGTTTCAPTFSNFALSTPLPCPIILDAAARVPPVYAADGSVRVRILSATDILQSDIDNLAIVTAASSSGGTPIPDSTQIFGTRDLKVRFDDQPVPGYVRLNGRTIGSATSGATERANADTQSLYIALWGYANITVVSGKGGSAAADFAANKQLTLPDMRGKLLGAMADMGAGVCASNCITSATVTSPEAAGATGGAQQSTLAQGNIPSYTLPDTLGISDTRTWSLPSSNYYGNYNGTNQDLSATVGTAGSLRSGVNTITPGGGSISKTGSVTSGGSGTAFTNVPPSMLLMFYIKL